MFMPIWILPAKTPQEKIWEFKKLNLLKDKPLVLRVTQAVDIHIMSAAFYYLTQKDF